MIERRDLLLAATGSAGVLIAGALRASSPTTAATQPLELEKVSAMPKFISANPNAAGLIEIGETAIVKEDAPRLRAYFADDFAFHGPAGDLTFDQLAAYFATLRAAFDDFAIERAQIIGEGDRPCALLGHRYTVSPFGSLGGLSERHEAFGVERNAIRPHIVASKIDVVPAQR